MVSQEPASPHPHNRNNRNIGIEIADGAMHLTAVLGGESSTHRWHTRLAAPPSPEEAVSHIHELIERVLREAAGEDTGSNSMPLAPTLSVAAIGVALWGEIDAADGIVRELRPLAGWHDFPLAAALHERWPIPVAIASAIATAALAEARQRANAEYGTLFYVHLGRTVSSACIRGGSITLGARAGEGMFAHMLVAPEGPRCSCGLFGHLEPIASAQAIVRTMIGLASDSEESTAAMLRISHGRAEAMSAAQVIQLAAEGEPTAARVVNGALDALALALANTVALVAPDVIVIGGLPATGEAILAPLRKRIDGLCRPFAAPPALRLSTLEPFSALIGAQLLAQSWHNT